MFESIPDGTWSGAALWAVLYASDHLLTLLCARMYRAQSNIVFEGSYELTPMFQSDVNALRIVSPRFVIALIASTAYLWLLRQFVGPSSDYFGIYVTVLGLMVLLQATVHMRHFRNWFAFRMGTRSIRGCVTYPRGLVLRMSAFELLLFAGLYVGLFIVTSSLFCLGGGLACAVLSLNHYRLARRHDVMRSEAA